MSLQAIEFLSKERLVEEEMYLVELKYREPPFSIFIIVTMGVEHD